MTNNLTRPIMGIESRTPLEVWQIMCDRIEHAHAHKIEEKDVQGVRDRYPDSESVMATGDPWKIAAWFRVEADRLARALQINSNEGASILKLAIERVCPDCQGACYVPNPHAHWETAEDGAEYCNGPEDIDCETCHGLGFVMPRKPEPPRLPQSQLEDDMPF